MYEQHERRALSAYSCETHTRHVFNQVTAAKKLTPIYKILHCLPIKKHDNFKGKAKGQVKPREADKHGIGHSLPSTGEGRSSRFERLARFRIRVLHLQHFDYFFNVDAVGLLSDETPVQSGDCACQRASARGETTGTDNRAGHVRGRKNREAQQTEKRKQNKSKQREPIFSHLPRESIITHRICTSTFYLLKHNDKAGLRLIQQAVESSR